MKNIKILKFSIMIFTLILLGNIATLAQKKDCSTQSETDLIISIYTKLKVKYADEIKHINITVENGVVTLDGWVTNEKNNKGIEKIVKKFKCVKSVKNEMTVGKGGGCAPGQKECGGACISEKQACNICLVDSSAPGCLTTTEKKP